MTGWCAAALLAAVVAVSPAARADDARDALIHANSGWDLLAAGNCAQALVEFQMAYEKAPNPDYIFNMAQCEYQLGDLKPALDHYQQYLKAFEGKPGRGKPDAMHLARMRIDVINRRESVIAINTEPLGADVVIEGNDRRLAGQAPNRFSVPRGHYDVTVSKAGFETRKLKLDVDVASAQPLFFNLRPTPGRLEIRTMPPDATLYVRGNRAQNPYIQQVEPGEYEIYAEATDFSPRREVVEVKAGQPQTVLFELPYVQRSGRPELITFFTATGALTGGGLVIGLVAQASAKKSPDPLQTGASASLVLAGALGGGIIGAVGSSVAQWVVPDYIRDNQALFRIGAMWVGIVDGAALGATVTRGSSFVAPWVGGALGLVAGGVTGAYLDGRAANYGRVAAIQSAAAIGALWGALVVPALKPNKAVVVDYFKHYEPIGILIGLNVGLGAGLALAYLPDQRVYGPRWQRVALIDLATAAGGFAGAVATTIDSCIASGSNGSCRFESTQPTARAALIGSVVGMSLGWLLTGKMDRNTPPYARSMSFLPRPTALPVTRADGSLDVIPGLGMRGKF